MTHARPDPHADTAHTATARVPTDTLLARLERRLRAAGATFDDIDQRLADELGVTFAEWHGYHTVCRAVDRYQHTRQPEIDHEGAPMH